MQTKMKHALIFEQCT